MYLDSIRIYRSQMSTGMRLISHLDLIGPFRGFHTYNALGYKIVNNEKIILWRNYIELALYPYSMLIGFSPKPKTH